MVGDFVMPTLACQCGIIKNKGGEHMAAEYVCPSCGGKVSEAEYQAGKTTCQTASCARMGQPFERKEIPAQMGMMDQGAKPAAKKPWYKFW